jgi:hypothetical protein
MTPFLLALTLAVTPSDLPPSDRLAAAFNKERGKVRVVMLVSPT